LSSGHPAFSIFGGTDFRVPESFYILGWNVVAHRRKVPNQIDVTPFMLDGPIFTGGFVGIE
jgi:hypothetical protein